jgi:hypothetical protein
MDKKIEKAFDFAQDATKQLIGLATGVIALTITFLTDVVKTAPPGSEGFLQASWVMYFVSIVFGVFTLLGLTGSLGAKETPSEAKETLSIYSRNIRFGSIAQIFTFAAALILTLVFGFKVL